MQVENIAYRIAEEVRQITGKHVMPLAALCDRGLFDLGIESHHLGPLLASINKCFGVELAITDFFDYPNINKLAALVNARAN